MAPSIEIDYYRQQRTLARSIAYEGIGLHTGQVVRMQLLPADEDTGVLFRRSDLAGSPCLPATTHSICEASERCTALGSGPLKIYTVEHLLAALYAHQVDNVIVDLSAVEPPIGDGSSDLFVTLIGQAGTIEQAASRRHLRLKEPLYWSSGQSSVIALPAPEYRVSYTLSYPSCKPLQAQFCSLRIDTPTFDRELAPCRTFCLYEEVAYLMDKGLIRGGSLDNAVVIMGEAVLSKHGLHFPDEMVRHKTLDLVGDLALVGCDLQAHIVAIRAGHAAHCAMAALLQQQIHNI